MTPPWSPTDITMLEVTLKYEEEYDKLCFNSNTKIATPALVDLCTLLGRPWCPTYEKLTYLRKNPEKRRHIDIVLKREYIF